jgi:hypothetical protein
VVNSNRRLLSEVLIDAPIDIVWTAISEPNQIQQWFGWQYEGLGEEVQEVFGRSSAEFDDAEHILRWPHGDELVLQAEDSATLLQTFRPTPEVDQMPDQAEDIDDGWTAFVEQLRFWLERHRGEQRATVYLSGPAREEHASISAALGLNVDGAPGARYELSAAGGERLAGSIWSRLGNVTCLTVDSYGDGLIVLVNHDARRHEPNGGGTVTITTYGLSDEALTSLKRRWVATFESKYEASADFGGETSS